MRNIIAAGIVLLATCVARGQDEDHKLLALQKAVQKTIQQNEAAIACILVSRSEFYPKKPNARPGELGVFDKRDVESDPRMTARERDQLVKKLDLADTNNVPGAFGSGVVIDSSGLILTNYHVVQDATKLFVRLPGGKSSYADIHAADPRSDLAVLRLISNVGPLKAISLSEADRVERGQFVVTLSNPYAAGFRDGQPSASWGILSNIRRRAPLNLKEEERIRPLHHYPTLLQTDARLNLGCSGGALLNMHGELIGLLTAMAAIQGGDTPGGYALPMNAGMRRIIDVLKRGEEVEYGFLGIAFDDPKPDAPVIKLSNVGSGSPAAEGKLDKGDELLAINDQPLRESEDVYVYVATHLAGSKVRLQFRRNGNERTADVTLAKLHVPGKAIASSLGKRPFYRGLRVDWGSLVAQQQLGRPIPRGVVVSDVQPNTAADRADLKAGDVILRVNQTEVPTPAAFYQAVAEAKGPIEFTLDSSPPVKIQLK